MEEFFSIFQKFFCAPPEIPGGGGEQPQQGPDLVRQPQQGGQDQAAEGEEVPPAPQGHRGHVVDAHLAVLPQQGEGEQPRRGPQPEQQIQREGQAGHLQAPAQGAHPVIGQAQQRPQQDPLPKDRRLARHVDAHGSAQQPGQEAAPAPRAVILIADGVDVSVYL